MAEVKKEVTKGGVSRRDFIKGAGLAVGGAAIGSTVIAACTPKAGPEEGKVTTKEVEVSKEVAQYVCPYDNQKFAGLKELQDHLDSAHGGAKIQAAELTRFTLNGKPVAIKIQDHWTLNYVIRDVLGMTGGTKYSCDEGICGMCSIIKDGKVVLSCMVLGVECEGASITTVEGLQDPKTGKLHATQQGFIDESGFMCGFCTTGNIMTAKVLLDKNPNPTRDQVREALSNNICACGGYELIQLSVLKAAQLMRGG